MYQSQNVTAAIFMSLDARYPQVGDALRLAGWTVRVIEGNAAQAYEAAGMIVVDGGDGASRWRGRPIVVAISESGTTPLSSAHLVIDPSQQIEQIAAQLSPWRIPDAAALVRMEGMFRRDGLLPVVEGLRDELEQALADVDKADAHRIAGLAGTLGFAAASASWQAVDRGDGAMTAALRDSHTALIAIDDWLRSAD